MCQHILVQAVAVQVVQATKVEMAGLLRAVKVV